MLKKYFCKLLQKATSGRNPTVEQIVREKKGEEKRLDTAVWSVLRFPC